VVGTCVAAVRAATTGWLMALSRKRHLLFETDTNNETVISEGCRHRRPSVESNYYVVKKPRK